MLKRLSCVVIAAFAFGAVLTSAPSLGAPAFPARSSDAQGVRVVVTPRSLGTEAVWEFEVAMDTHTKPLSEDLAKAAVLVDDEGRRHAPMAWQGDPPGGHHRSGILRFAAVAPKPRTIELQIDGVGGAGTRSFRWALN